MVFKGDRIISSEYKKLSKPVKLRLLHEYIQQLDLDYDFKKISEIYEFIESNINQRNGSTMSLASAKWLYADEKFVEKIPRKNIEEKEIIDILIPSDGEYPVKGKKFSLRRHNEKELFVFPESTSNFAYADFSNIQFPLTLRTRRDGDIITPFGMRGTMKLKKYLNSKGVPRHNRDDILLLCKENEVLWVLGVGISDKIGVKGVPTHVIEFI